MTGHHFIDQNHADCFLTCARMASGMAQNRTRQQELIWMLSLLSIMDNVFLLRSCHCLQSGLTTSSLMSAQSFAKCSEMIISLHFLGTFSEWELLLLVYIFTRYLKCFHPWHSHCLCKSIWSARGDTHLLNWQRSCKGPHSFASPSLGALGTGFIRQTKRHKTQIPVILLTCCISIQTGNEPDKVLDDEDED